MELSGYQIHKPLGCGGMATVYLATQDSFGRKVAIKVLDSKNLDDGEFVSRFIREAKLIASLAHPHILPVYDVGQNNGHIYMSMEYLSGGNLSQWIKRGLLPEEALSIVSDMAQALQFSHDQGVIHRDIKPDNIMFRENNSAVLTDFGIARRQDDKNHLTQKNTVLGTPKYMSPEQLMGLRVDGRSDLYALGVVFYESLMRRPPFEAEDYSALSMKHLNEPVPRLPKSLQIYQPILDKLMAKKSEHRFQNGREVGKAIANLRDAMRAPASAPDLTIVESSSSPTPKSSAVVRGKKFVEPKKSTRAGDIGVRTSGFRFVDTHTGFGPFKKYTLECDVVTTDAHTFGIQFSAVSTEILRWHDTHKRKACAVEFVISSNKVAFDKIKQIIACLCADSDHYGFMQKLKVTVCLSDQFGVLAEEYQL